MNHLKERFNIQQQTLRNSIFKVQRSTDRKSFLSKTRNLMRNMSRLSVLLLICWCVFAEDEFGDNCESCGVDADQAVHTLAYEMRRIKNFTLEEIKPCEKCIIYGVSTMKRNETVPTCRNKTADGGYFLVFNVYFTNISFVCTCNLNANPMVLTKDIESALKSSSKIKDCTPQEQAEIADSIKKGGGLSLTGPEMLKLTACKPSTTAVIPAKTEYSGEIHATSKDFAVSFISVVAPGTDRVSIKNINVLKKSFESLVVKCSGDSGFKSACQCLLATNFHSVLAVKAAYSILPCDLGKQTQAVDELMQYFKCEP